MKLSVLDAIHKPAGATSAQALRASIGLAREAERLGFHRYWVVEHHGVPFEANPAPEVFAVALANATSRIRIGVGGVLLNHHSPYKVAEAYRTLEALFPGRIDAGIGRAPAGPPESDLALKRVRDAATPDDHDEQVRELVGWLGNDHEPGSPFAAIRIMGDEPAGPLPWILAASQESAARAAHLGLPLAFSAFINPEGAAAAIETYRREFRPSRFAAGVAEPMPAIAVRAVVGETLDEAERLAMPIRAIFKQRRFDKIIPATMPTPEEAEAILGGFVHAETSDWPPHVLGTADQVKAKIGRMAEITGVADFIVQDFLPTVELRSRNLRLLAQAFDL